MLAWVPEPGSSQLPQSLRVSAHLAQVWPAPPSCSAWPPPKGKQGRPPLWRLVAQSVPRCAWAGERLAPGYPRGEAGAQRPRLVSGRLEPLGLWSPPQSQVCKCSGHFACDRLAPAVGEGFLTRRWLALPPRRPGRHGEICFPAGLPPTSPHPPLEAPIFLGTPSEVHCDPFWGRNSWDEACPLPPSQAACVPHPSPGSFGLSRPTWWDDAGAPSTQGDLWPFLGSQLTSHCAAPTQQPPCVRPGSR